MIKDYYIFDGVVSNYEQNVLYDYVKNSDIKWDFMENITGEYGGKQLTHKFPAKVHPQTFCENQYVKDIVDNLQKIVSEKLKLEFVKNYRWKINWTTPIEDGYNPMDLLHYDRINEHIAMVYYINDSTGDTCFYDNINGNNAESVNHGFNNINYEHYSLLKKITPKMGRCVVFDGKLAHYGDYPLNGDRFIINFNFAAKYKNTRNII